LDNGDLHSPLASGEDLDPEVFPYLGTVSAAFFFQFMPIPRGAVPTPEFVYVPMPSGGTPRAATLGRLAQWNMLWEARHLRHELPVARELPKRLRWLRRHPESDFRLVPLEGETRYAAYAPLYHLLPLRVLRRFGLPAIKRDLWPIAYDVTGVTERALPADWEARLSQAVAFHLWPFLCQRSGPSRFSQTEPIRLLAHNLDFWMPYLDLVAQQRCAQVFERCGFDDEYPDQQRKLADARRQLAGECDVERPLMGGPVWMGESEALDVACALVEAADARGNLRAIIEAVKSNRIADDFSSRWSWEREDFERKLYRRRTKIRPVFVEVNDTVPVHGPTSEAEENLLWQDFFALLNVRERRIVVCLRSGISGATEIARELGYANHSPVSKALTLIRRKAETFLDN
jgi:hypothetical protein